MADWFVARLLDSFLGAVFMIAVGYFLKDASWSRRLRFSVCMAVFAVICFTAIHFLP
jgi:hypothetical protein